MKIYSFKIFSLIIFLFTTSVNSQKVHSHAIETILRPSIFSYEITSSFSNGEPLVGAKVRILSSDGSILKKLGELNSQGKLVFKLPENLSNGNYDIQIDGGPGHRDYLLITINS